MTECGMMLPPGTHSLATGVSLESMCGPCPEGFPWHCAHTPSQVPVHKQLDHQPDAPDACPIPVCTRAIQNLPDSWETGVYDQEQHREQRAESRGQRAEGRGQRNDRPWEILAWMASWAAWTQVLCSSPGDPEWSTVLSLLSEFLCSLGWKHSQPRSMLLQPRWHPAAHHLRLSPKPVYLPPGSASI